MGEPAPRAPTMMASNIPIAEDADGGRGRRTLVSAFAAVGGLDSGGVGQKKVVSRAVVLRQEGTERGRESADCAGEQACIGAHAAHQTRVAGTLDVARANAKMAYACH